MIRLGLGKEGCVVEPVRQQLSLFVRADAWVQRFRVSSQTVQRRSYTVAVHKAGHLGCSCPGWKFAGGKPDKRSACRHIREVQESGWIASTASAMPAAVEASAANAAASCA